MHALEIDPVILSSYIPTSPAQATEAAFQEAACQLQKRVQRFGFQKVRLFPGSGIKPEDNNAIAIVARRIAELAASMPSIDFLLETHDGSIADDPHRLIELLQSIVKPNIGLLYQPTVFESAFALSQLEIQRPWIRHLHLQNRATTDAGRFVRLGEGSIPWKTILAAVDRSTIGATLEFVPSAIGPIERFQFDLSLNEAISETSWVHAMLDTLDRV
jgi:sugar phosphate isomerase/epimerase